MASESRQVATERATSLRQHSTVALFHDRRSPHMLGSYWTVTYFLDGLSKLSKTESARRESPHLDSSLIPIARQSCRTLMNTCAGQVCAKSLSANIFMAILNSLALSSSLDPSRFAKGVL